MVLVAVQFFSPGECFGNLVSHYASLGKDDSCLLLATLIIWHSEIFAVLYIHNN